MKRACIALLSLAVIGSPVDAQPSGDLQLLTPEEVAKLEPELCQPASSFFQAMTAALPFLVGSRTADITPEQIALVDQHKASGRRKVWVLRLPAAFIDERTCDAGRKNWVGEGDDRRVSQGYRLAVIMLSDRIIPLSLASKGEFEQGIRARIYLENEMRNPASLHRAYRIFSSVGLVDAIVPVPQRCRDVPSEIPGLVTFRRIDPSVRSWLDCEAFSDTQLFAKKLDELTYDFLASCSFNCRVKSNYHGWDVQYLYHHTYLAEWQRIHERLTHFLDQHTVYLDEDGTNAVAGER